MQITLAELIGFIGIVTSIATGVWVISDRFGKLEGRVGRLEEKFVKLEEKFVKLEEKVGNLEKKLDEILFYLAPKIKRKKMKHIYRKEKGFN